MNPFLLLQGWEQVCGGGDSGELEAAGKHYIAQGRELAGGEKPAPTADYRQGRHNKVPETRGLKTTKCVFSQIWRLEV